MILSQLVKPMFSNVSIEQVFYFSCNIALYFYLFRKDVLPTMAFYYLLQVLATIFIFNKDDKDKDRKNKETSHEDNLVNKTLFFFLESYRKIMKHNVESMHRWIRFYNMFEMVLGMIQSTLLNKKSQSSSSTSPTSTSGTSRTSVGGLEDYQALQRKNESGTSEKSVMSVRRRIINPFNPPSPMTVEKLETLEQNETILKSNIEIATEKEKEILSSIVQEEIELDKLEEEKEKCENELEIIEQIKFQSSTIALKNDETDETDETDEADETEDLKNDETEDLKNDETDETDETDGMEEGEIDETNEFNKDADETDETDDEDEEEEDENVKIHPLTLVN